MAPNNKDQDEKVALNFQVNGELKSYHSESTEDILCGIGPCKPKFLQCFVHMSAFTGIYSISGLMTQILSIYIVSQITTIEKQFGFSSSESGFLMSCNDIGFLLTTLMFSYFARKVHIPRTLWACTVLYGISGIICSFSYFIAKDLIEEQAEQVTKVTSLPVSIGNTSGISNPQTFIISGTPMCSVTNTTIARVLNDTTPHGLECSNTADTFEVGQPNRFSRLAMGLIAVGMIFQGIAKAPRYPYLTTYVDDNVKKKNTAMYIGIIAGVGIFGPAIAFFLGGLFSRIYVTLEEVTISPRHPAWIGAWWLGFVIFGVLSIILSFPLLLFPRKMKNKPIREKKVNQSTDIVGIRDFTKSLMKIVSNSVFMPQAFAECILLFTVAGSMSFTPKYIEAQFSVPTWKVNMLIGVITVVAASAGSVTGGLVVTKRKLSPVQCVKLNIVITTLSLTQNGLGFVFGCSNVPLVGHNIESTYQNTSVPCAASCNCDSSAYFPVCGSDNRNYFSPCHAGCTHQGNMLYSNCSCIQGVNTTATPGLCEDNNTCNMLYPFLISCAIGAFLGTLSMMPGLIIKIRSVSERDKSLAVGFAALLVTLLGWMAGPIVFGMIVDTTCAVWSSSCSGKGACSLYDNDLLRVRKHISLVIPKSFTILLYFFVLYKASKKTDWSVDKAESKETESTLAETEKMMNE